MDDLTSVVLIVRNGEDTIGRQLAALERQVAPPPFELIVVDNGSTDATASAVTAWLAQTPCDARLVDGSTHRGIPFARNVGVAESKGKFIAFCDADDEVEPSWLSQLIEPLRSTDGAVAGFKRYVTSLGEPAPDSGPPGLQEAKPFPFAPTCNLAVTRRVAVEIGGFDESLPRYGFEDVDFCWRLQRAGYPLLYQPEARVTYYVSQKTVAARKVFLTARAHMAMTRRHKDFGDQAPTLGGSISNVLRAGLRLPYRLIRPGTHSRQRCLRELIESAGQLAGYWHYWHRKHDIEPRYLSIADQLPPVMP